MEGNARFEDLELDPAGAEIQVPVLTEEEAPSRWSSPEVEGAEIPQYEGYNENRKMSEYVVGNGPASLALQRAGLSAPITLERLGVVTGLPCVNDGRYFAVYDHNSRRQLGRPVTKGYKICQNATMAAMIDAIVEPSATVEVKSWNHGEKIAFECDFGLDAEKLVTDETRERVRELRRKFNVRIHGWEGGDNYVPPNEAKLLVVNTHGGNGRVFAKLRFQFKVCDNGLCQNLNDGGFVFTHSAYLDERIEQARQAFTLARESAGEHQELFARMFGTYMNATQFSEFLNELYPETKKILQNAKAKARLDAQRSAFQKTYLEAPGAAPKTVYGVLAATTYTTTHGIEVRRVKNELQAQHKRYELQIEGRGNQLNQQAMNWCYQQLAA